MRELYHKNRESYAEERFPRDRDIDLSYNPPEGLTSTDIRHMSEEDLLDMDYFLNDDDLDEEFGEEGFYLF